MTWAAIPSPAGSRSVHAPGRSCSRYRRCQPARCRRPSSKAKITAPEARTIVSLRQPPSHHVLEFAGQGRGVPLAAEATGWIGVCLVSPGSSRGRAEFGVRAGPDDGGLGPSGPPHKAGYTNWTCLQEWIELPVRRPEYAEIPEKRHEWKALQKRAFPSRNTAIRSIAACQSPP